jgi:hypothetical protein
VTKEAALAHNGYTHSGAGADAEAVQAVTVLASYRGKERRICRDQYQSDARTGAKLRIACGEGLSDHRCSTQTPTYCFITMNHAAMTGPCGPRPPGAGEAPAGEGGAGPRSG